MYDVIVIGAGPADGTAALYMLRRSNLSVLMIEQAFPWRPNEQYGRNRKPSWFRFNHGS